MFERVFGISQKQKSTILGAIDCGAIRYLGGHKAYPQPVLSEIYFYEDRFEIETNHISVHYSKIKDITNSNEMKRDTERLGYGLLLPPLALAYLWKKNHVYKIIEYDDGYDIQKIVLDFEKGASYAQSLIYKKMLDYRTTEFKKPERTTECLQKLNGTAELNGINITSKAWPKSYYVPIKKP